jgi:hypothetical protein
LSPYFGGLVGGPLVALLFAIASGAQVGLLLDLFHVFLGIWLVGVVVGMGVIGVGLPTRLKMELAAGYTTANFAHPEVDLVDSKTGIVLRNAGEPLLDRSSFKALREEARALARSESAAVSGNEA